MVASRRSCCCGELVVLGLQALELGGDPGPPGQRLAGEVLAVLGERLAGLVLQLRGRSAGAAGPGARCASWRWRRRRARGGPAGAARAASRTTGRACRGDPPPGRAPCWPWPGRCSSGASSHPSALPGRSASCGQHRRRQGGVLAGTPGRGRAPWRAGAAVPVACRPMTERLCVLTRARPPRRRGLQGGRHHGPVPRRGRPHRARDLHRRRGGRHPEPGHGHARGHGRPRRGAPPRARAAVDDDRLRRAGPARLPRLGHAGLRANNDPPSLRRAAAGGDGRAARGR